VNAGKDAQANVPFDKSVAHGLVGGITSILGGGNFAQGALASWNYGVRSCIVHAGLAFSFGHTLLI